MTKYRIGNKYKIGDKFYKLNKTTKEIEEIQIKDIQYVFSKKISSKLNYTEEEIEELIDKGVITDDKDDIKNKAIADLEKRFGIKLQEIK